jgi:transcription initiation factor TFIIIB Brf1 subunit/transcription initiation factor TFIIB
MTIQNYFDGNKHMHSLIKRVKGLQTYVSHVHNTMATIVHRNSLKTTKTWELKHYIDRDYINKLITQAYGLKTWQRGLAVISSSSSNLKRTKSPSLNSWLLENSSQL